MHKRFVLHTAGILMMLCCVLVPQEVLAFTFATDNGALRTVAVEDAVFGETWAHATTESGDTVWKHCENALTSYGTYTSRDVSRCEADVARVNSTEKHNLDVLRVGEDIILPLTRTESESLTAVNETTVPTGEERDGGTEFPLNDQNQKGTQEQIQTEKITDTSSGDGGESVATLEEEVAILEERVTNQGNILSDNVSELQLKNTDTEAALTRLERKIDLLITQIAAQTEAQSLTKDAGNTEERTAVPTQPGVLWTIVGIYGMLVAGSIIFLVLWQTERRKRNTAIPYEKLGDEKLQAAQLDFSKKPYPFDGIEYWVALSKVTKDGRFFVTPFADEVKEQNLKSHFAQATKVKTHYKEVA